MRIYDPTGRTTAALRRLGFDCQAWNEHFELLDILTPLVIGERAWDAQLTQHASRLQAFVRAGGRVLVLQPDAAQLDTTWLGAKVQAVPRNGMWVNLERPAHPVFAGLTHWDFEWWSDYTGWRQGQAELPRIHPATVRFSVADAADLARVAVLANFDVGLRSIALCEVFDGLGSVILSGFDLVARAGLDPVADRLLANLVRFSMSKAGHEVYPLLASPVVWGDYATEQGAVVSSQQGLLVNQDRDHPRGRRLLGPFQYGGPTNGYVIDPKPAANEGWGRVFVRIPAGRQVMLTRVENPAKADLLLAVTLNGVTTQHVVSGGASTVVRTPLPAATNLDLTYAGDKRLVLLTTEFD